ncbi:MAG TPA: hypothetical protein VNC84_03805 [Gammaproteobacteria bacterium]|nr:hypothetical protein [Gammaproteobacteria bacterium]
MAGVRGWGTGFSSDSSDDEEGRAASFIPSPGDGLASTEKEKAYDRARKEFNTTSDPTFQPCMGDSFDLENLRLILDTMRREKSNQSKADLKRKDDTFKRMNDAEKALYLASAELTMEWAEQVAREEGGGVFHIYRERSNEIESRSNLWNRRGLRLEQQSPLEAKRKRIALELMQLKMAELKAAADAVVAGGTVVEQVDEVEERTKRAEELSILGERLKEGELEKLLGPSTLIELRDAKCLVVIKNILSDLKEVLKNQPVALEPVRALERALNAFCLTGPYEILSAKKKTLNNQNNLAAIRLNEALTLSDIDIDIDIEIDIANKAASSAELEMRWLASLDADMKRAIKEIEKMDIASRTDDLGTALARILSHLTFLQPAINHLDSEEETFIQETIRIRGVFLRRAADLWIASARANLEEKQNAFRENSGCKESRRNFIAAIEDVYELRIHLERESAALHELYDEFYDEIAYDMRSMSDQIETHIREQTNKLFKDAYDMRIAAQLPWYTTQAGYSAESKKMSEEADAAYLEVYAIDKEKEKLEAQVLPDTASNKEKKKREKQNRQLAKKKRYAEKKQETSELGAHYTKTLDSFLKKMPRDEITSDPVLQPQLNEFRNSLEETATELQKMWHVVYDVLKSEKRSDSARDKAYIDLTDPVDDTPSTCDVRPLDKISTSVTDQALLLMDRVTKVCEKVSHASRVEQEMERIALILAALEKNDKEKLSEAIEAVKKNDGFRVAPDATPRTVAEINANIAAQQEVINGARAAIEGVEKSLQTETNKKKLLKQKKMIADAEKIIVDTIKAALEEETTETTDEEINASVERAMGLHKRNIILDKLGAVGQLNKWKGREIDPGFREFSREPEAILLDGLRQTYSHFLAKLRAEKEIARFHKEKAISVVNSLGRNITLGGEQIPAITQDISSALQDYHKDLHVALQDRVVALQNATKHLAGAREDWGYFDVRKLTAYAENIDGQALYKRKLLLTCIALAALFVTFIILVSINPGLVASAMGTSASISVMSVGGGVAFISGGAAVVTGNRTGASRKMMNGPVRKAKEASARCAVIEAGIFNRAKKQLKSAQKNADFVEQTVAQLNKRPQA